MSTTSILPPTAAQQQAAQVAAQGQVLQYNGALGWITTNAVSNQNIANGFSIASKPKFTVTGRSSKSAPCSEAFRTCKDIFRTDYDLLCDDQEGYMVFHYHVWERIHGTEYPDYGYVLQGEHAHIAFGSAESRDQFEDWIATYRQTFLGGNLKQHIPTLPEGRISGCTIMDPIPLIDRYLPCPYQRLDMWVWIVAKCYHPVYRTHGGFFFTDLTEATFYKMRPEDNGLI